MFLASLPASFPLSGEVYMRLFFPTSSAELCDGLPLSLFKGTVAVWLNFLFPQETFSAYSGWWSFSIADSDFFPFFSRVQLILRNGSCLFVISLLRSVLLLLPSPPPLRFLIFLGFNLSPFLRPMLQYFPPPPPLLPL